MQLWLFVIGAVACVALSGATPAGGNEKPVVGKEPSHHHIRKRQLEAVNSLSGLRKCMKARYGMQFANILCSYHYISFSLY